MRSPLRIARLVLATLALAAFALLWGGLGCALMDAAHTCWPLAAPSAVLRLQAGPAILRAILDGAPGALWTLAGLAAFTFIFGRFFCSILCPLGIWQDIVGRAARRKCVSVPDAPWLRCAILGLALGTLALGFAAVFQLLDPYSIAYRAASSLSDGAFLAGAILPFAAVTALALWKRRVYCVSLCPVGVLLGLLSKKGPLGMRVAPSCIKCRQCEKVCPTACIDSAEGAIDNERCVRCMACLDACSLGAISYGSTRKSPAAAKEPAESPPASPSRRAFIRNALVAIGGLAAGAAIARAGLAKAATAIGRKLGILPPGAIAPEKFAARCTGCLRCVEVCPGKIIKPPPGGFGPVSVDLSDSYCRFCSRCGSACPTGAIMPFARDAANKPAIGKVEFHPDICIAFQFDDECGKCAAACPTQAITLRKNGTPRVSAPDACIGCGRCQYECPAEGKAMRVVPFAAGEGQ